MPLLLGRLAEGSDIMCKRGMVLTELFRGMLTFEEEIYPAIFTEFQKSLVSVKTFARFWGWKWLCQFYGRLEKLRSFCRKTSVPAKFLILGGGVIWFFFLGGEVPIFFFYGRDDFSENCLFCRTSSPRLHLLMPRPHSVERHFSSLISTLSHTLPRTPFQTKTRFLSCLALAPELPESRGERVLFHGS